METESSHIFDWQPFSTLLLTGFDSAMLGYILSTIFLLICSGFLSGSEVAFFSIGHKEKSKLIEAQSAVAKRILTLLEKPRYLLSTILIANNLVNIAIILVSDSLLGMLIPDNLPTLLDWTLRVGAVTFLLVLFGEVAPKVYATQNNMRIARIMSRPLLMFRYFFRPISWMLVNSTKVVENRLRTRLGQDVISQEDIASAIELTVKGNKYAKQDVDILKGIVRFGNTSAAEIMKPRMKVYALDIESSFEEVVAAFKEKSYSRIPIYEEDLDNIKGIIHAKDLLEHLNDTAVDWHSLIRPAIVTPERRKIDDLFSDFQEKRTHMAIVVDEYGGTKGIVTMEDVLEEIVGEILDEFDEVEEKGYKKVDDYTYDFDGSTPIIDICKTLDVPNDFFDDLRQGAETIAGLILVLNGSIPALNQPLACKDYHLITLAANKRRIEKVRIVLPRENNINLSSSVSKT